MKKFLTMLLVFAMLFSMCAMFTACDDNKDTQDTTGASDTTAKADTTDAAATPEEPKVLTMGTNAEFPPYEYIEGGEIVGIDAEIAAAIAEKLGMTLKIENMEFDAIIPAIESGKVQISLAGMTVTEERKQSVNFSSSYATGIQVVIVKEDADFDVDDLFELKADGSKWKVGVQNGTTGDIYATGDLEEPEDDNGNPLPPTATIEHYSKGADAVQALVAGKIDCVIIDNEPAKAFVAANEGLTILDTEYALEEYAIAVAKNEEELLNRINVALEELIEDGTVDKIVDKYIKAD